MVARLIFIFFICWEVRGTLCSLNGPIKVVQMGSDLELTGEPEVEPQNCATLRLASRRKKGDRCRSNGTGAVGRLLVMVKTLLYADAS